MKINYINKITGVIYLLSGLHIGAGKDAIQIGGLDQPIIKHPISREPYIPGSSLKGKMRSLLETYYFIKREETRDFVARGKPCGCGKSDCPSCCIFGCSDAENRKNNEGLGPTRLLVRDALLCEEDKLAFDKGELPMEVKYENTIHRVQGVAEHPRPLERVPAGVRFNFELSFKRFEGDDENWLDHVYKGLKLIELDALGGCGSRGSGQVKFMDVVCGGENVDIESIEL